MATLPTTITSEYIESLANNLLYTLWTIDGITYDLKALGWTFAFNNAKKALGSCSRTKKQISLSRFLLKHNISLDIWEDTIKHEIAHAIDFVRRDKSDHGPEWISIAKQIGCEIARTYNGELKISESKYILKCDNCGNEHPCHRKRKRAVACNNCCTTYNNGMFTDKYLLEYVSNT